MSPDPDPPVHLDGQGEDPSPPPPRRNGPAGPRRPTSRSALIRFLVLAVSVGGVLAALVLWASGHGASALRVLAGDVLALVVLLLAAR